MKFKAILNKLLILLTHATSWISASLVRWANNNKYSLVPWLIFIWVLNTRVTSGTKWEGLLLGPAILAPMCCYYHCTIKLYRKIRDCPLAIHSSISFVYPPVCSLYFVATALQLCNRPLLQTESHFLWHLKIKLTRKLMGSAG